MFGGRVSLCSSLLLSVSSMLPFKMLNHTSKDFDSPEGRLLCLITPTDWLLCPVRRGSCMFAGYLWMNVGATTRKHVECRESLGFTCQVRFIHLHFKIIHCSAVDLVLSSPVSLLWPLTYSCSRCWSTYTSLAQASGTSAASHYSTSAADFASGNHCLTISLSNYQAANTLLLAC